MSKITTGDTVHTKPLTLDELIAMPEEDINYEDTAYDPNDAKAVEEFWAGAVIKKGETVLGHTPKRGKQKAPTKQATTLRLDPEILDAFKATGKGWQTRMNAALSDWLKKHDPQKLRI